MSWKIFGNRLSITVPKSNICLFVSMFRQTELNVSFSNCLKHPKKPSDYASKGEDGPRTWLVLYFTVSVSTSWFMVEIMSISIRPSVYRTDWGNIGWTSPVDSPSISRVPVTGVPDLPTLSSLGDESSGTNLSNWGVHFLYRVCFRQRFVHWVN